MRWHILKTLLQKEALRHATNRGGLALAGLLIAASLLAAALNPAGDKSSSLVGGVRFALAAVFIVFWCRWEGAPLSVRRGQWTPIVISGALLFLQIVTFNLGTERSTASPCAGAAGIPSRPRGPTPI